MNYLLTATIMLMLFVSLFTFVFADEQSEIMTFINKIINENFNLRYLAEYWKNMYENKKCNQMVYSSNSPQQTCVIEQNGYIHGFDSYDFNGDGAVDTLDITGFKAYQEDEASKFKQLLAE